MIDHVPFWKLVIRNDNIITAGIFYRFDDQKFRKTLAAFTNKTEQGKNDLIMILKNDLNRSYIEISEPMLSFIITLYGIQKIIPLAISKDKVRELLDSSLKIFDPDPNDILVRKYKELSDFFYTRKIGGHDHTKIMLGKQVLRKK